MRGVQLVRPAAVLSSLGPVRSCQTSVIRVPRYLQRRLEDVKQARTRHQVPTARAGKLLIQSRNPVLNQSAGFILGKFEKPVLCSKGWKHSKSFGDHFTIQRLRDAAPFIVNEEDRDQQDRDQQDPCSFRRLHLCKRLLETLRRMNITRPTTVQMQTIPQVLRGHNVLCAAETGSGKTLSYLLPLVQRLQAEGEAAPDGEGLRALVLVPSRELAEQVVSVSQSVCAPFGLTASVVGGGHGVGHVKNVFQHGVPDVLVATPGALLKALRRRYLDLGVLRFAVVDEADTMFDPSFCGVLEDILRQVHVAASPNETRCSGHRAQLLVVGATFPGGVGDVLSRVMDLGSVVVVKSRMLHFLMPHVTQTFLKIRGADKVLELNRALKEGGGGGVLVFCNKSTTVNWLGYALDELGVQHARIQGEMPAAVRAGVFRSFQDGATDVLVCTDIASRGLDTTRVRLVLNYDFPETHADYIHRAGRVGRAGGVQDGQVLSFVTHPWDVELVQRMETAARRRMRLPGMEKEIQEPKPAQGEAP